MQLRMKLLLPLVLRQQQTPQRLQPMQLLRPLPPQNKIAGITPMKTHTFLLTAAFGLLAACGESSQPAPAASESASTEAAPAAAPATAVAKSGADVFKKCAACHSVTPDGRNGIGPGLHGVSGRAVASVQGFTYSNALKGKGGVWDDAALDAFIAAPAKWAPGTKMMFAGISDPADRKALVEYLATLK